MYFKLEVFFLIDRVLFLSSLLLYATIVTIKMTNYYWFVIIVFLFKNTVNISDYLSLLLFPFINLKRFLSSLIMLSSNCFFNFWFPWFPSISVHIVDRSLPLSLVIFVLKRLTILSLSPPTVSFMGLGI